MKKLQGHGLKTSLAAGALQAKRAQRKPVTAADIEIPAWWWGGTDIPKIPHGLGE
jgi:hypothetical protein